MVKQQLCLCLACCSGASAGEEGQGCLKHHFPLCCCCRRTCFTRSKCLLLLTPEDSKGLPDRSGIMCLTRTVTPLKLLVMLEG